jgi:hypothetical protein
MRKQAKTGAIKRDAKQTKKTKYQVRNWREYNAGLVRRGSITVWISPEALANWKPKVDGPRQRGGQTQYSDEAVACILTLRAVLNLPLRQTEGFGQSILDVLGTGLKAPDYTTLCKRGKDVTVNLGVSQNDEPLHILVDSTGLKVYGEGEWKVRKHGYSKRRTWRKLHLGVNEVTQEIEAVELTEVSDDDAGTGSQMLDDISKPIGSVRGDGGYDKRKFYQTCAQRQISEAIIPPQRNARIWQHGNSAKPPLLRDQNLRRIRWVGRKRWKTESGYHRRSLVETAVFRFKTVFGSQLRARTFDRQIVEARIKCRALNIMTRLGLPDSYPVPA